MNWKEYGRKFSRAYFKVQSQHLLLGTEVRIVGPQANILTWDHLNIKQES
jgi:hypothetical protein